MAIHGTLQHQVIGICRSIAFQPSLEGCGAVREAYLHANMATETSQPQCPSAPVIRRNGFQLCGRTFHPLPAGASRVEGSRLLELFFPERLRLKRDQKESAASAKSLFRKPFFAAQLRWYGIPFRSTATVSDLEQLLKDAVVSGQVSSFFS